MSRSCPACSAKVCDFDALAVAALDVQPCLQARASMEDKVVIGRTRKTKPAPGSKQSNGHGSLRAGAKRTSGGQPDHGLGQLLLALRAADRGDFAVRLLPSAEGG